MRKILLIGALSAASVAMATAPKSMVIHTDTGVKTYSIANLRKLTFGAVQENNMEVHLKSGSVMFFPYSQMGKVTFSENSGVTNVNIDSSKAKIVYDIVSEELRIISTESIKQIQVYDMRGAMPVVYSPAENEASLSLSSLASGVYVVRVVGESSVMTEKIVKR